LPLPPTSLLVTSVTASSISLSWNTAGSPPDPDTRDPVTSFTVQYRATGRRRDDVIPGVRPGDDVTQRGFREIRDVIGREYDVTGLQAFTRYELRVISVNSVGRSQPSHSVDATTSQLGMI